MKKILFTVLIVSLSIFGLAYEPCPTLEQQQEAYNRKKAAEIYVRDTYTQQLQCHYNQLATYYQQLDKDNQQKAKDIQQIAKDAQQIAYDKQLIERALALDQREATHVDCDVQHLIELLETIQPGECTCEILIEEIRRHINHSGGADDTNPGGGGNEDGYLNPNNTP